MAQIDQFNQMREARGIPLAEVGMRISVDGREGRIVGANSSQNLNVCFVGDGQVRNCHPRWRTIFYDADGGVVYQFTDETE
jgi:hypothetical protein